MKLDGDGVERIVLRVVKYGLSTGFVAGQFGVSQRRVEQLVKEYKETGLIPVLNHPGRKPYAEYPGDLRDEILRAKAKLRYGASGVGHYLRKARGIKVDNNRVHAILLEEGYGKSGAE
jgi:putative transposase